MGRRIMEWAARSDYMGGIPRKMVLTAVGGLAKAVVSLFNSTTVHNADTLLRLVRSRPNGVPLVTVSNHMSTMDDPFLWAFKGFPITDANLSRGGICFYVVIWSGKCIPITRGGGIYQEHMNEALERLSEGSWLHTFPEGKVYQEDAPIRRLKWGTASLIARAPVNPIVLPIVHTGFEQVMPDKFHRGKRPPFPLWNKDIKIIVGEPMDLDLPEMRQMATSLSRNTSHSTLGWPSSCPGGLDEAAQKHLYSAISEKIQNVMERLRIFAKSFSKSRDQNLC
ncbi:N-acylphosphatidylethanolamine synthase-like isoform X2 [Malus sylvestris]|uniref:N-acylphosphatidylethanolamine synthase-like isoform X2 n=1 Tax=Malus sylvestris TaxID=3752 RepID=UPI0021AC171C|nr:N-acylphosphatidylethanolamine synthase-like isoform X2 [Malus sylvestris]